MSADAESALPNLGEALGRILVGVPRERQPLLIAIAERMAAERYRGWAADAAVRNHQADLLACAAREDEIAHRVEALFPSAAATQRELIAENPDFEAINRAIFAGCSLAQQFTIQARGERLGAATWRAFAKREANSAARATFLACAALEEESAAVLESLQGRLGDGA